MKSSAFFLNHPVFFVRNFIDTLPEPGTWTCDASYHSACYSIEYSGAILGLLFPTRWVYRTFEGGGVDLHWGLKRS